MKKNFIITFIIVITAILTRLMFLDLRPLHHDEGVNFFFASNIMESGRFIYDPLNYHGPFYFFSIFLSFLIFGISEFSLRFPSAFYGIILAIVPIFFRSQKNSFHPFIASFFLLFSPSLVYYSRYSIHETSFVLLSALTIFSLAFILRSKDIRYLPYFALSLALLFAIKETGVIILFILFIILLIEIKTIKELQLRKNINIIYLSVFLFFFIYISLFTGFFKNIPGFYESIRGYLPWLQRGYTETGHFKPWYYYLLLIYKYEAPLLILGLPGLWYAWKSVFSRSIAIWFIVHAITYSLIQYKMPWLVINITAPLCFLCAIGYKHLPLSIASKNLIYGSGIILLFIFSWTTSIIYPWQQVNEYAYVHTFADTVSLSERINSIAQKHSSVLIVADDYWPLPFYLRGKSVEYLSKIQTVTIDNYPKNDIFIIQEKILSSSIIPEGFAVEKFTLRDGIILNLVYRNPAN